MDPTPPVAALQRVLAALQKALNHELPNRLVAVQGLARLLDLEEGERLGPEGRDYLARIAAGADRLHALVSALAEVARLARPAPPAEAVDLAEVVAEVLTEAKQLAPDRSAEYHGPGPGLIVSVPRTALCRVLVLLLRRAGAGRVEVSTRAGAEIRITGDGLGLPPEMIELLFEPFTGQDDPGLDLFLARQLAEGWGGAVRVESAPGAGSAFVVSCPPKRAV
jgi:signal transduction histidine kinase